MRLAPDPGRAPMRLHSGFRKGALALCVALGCTIDFGDDTPPSGGTGVLDDDDGGGSNHDCCEAHDDADCENPILSSCVCEADPACCEDRWDAHCVAQVEALGCGICGQPGTCCEVHEGPGCEVPTVQACVCEYDPTCCQSGWDDQCVADVFLFGCGMCPGRSSCCVADGAPGCSQADVQACVCADEPQCCAIGWDFACVQAVERLGCGTCTAAESSSG